MNSENFFKKNKCSINKIYPKLKLKKNTSNINIKPLSIAKKNDLTFYDSKKYKKLANSTYCKRCNFKTKTRRMKKIRSTFAPDSKQYKSRRNLKIRQYKQKLRAFQYEKILFI